MTAAAVVGMELAAIELKELHESPRNPRKDFEPVALKELADNLVAEGQITPCIVRPRPQGGYELAAGHRRYRAAKLVGLPSLYCVVREMDDRTFLEVLTIENLQREDLHPLEEARGFRSLMDDIGYDIPRIADRVGRSVQYVYDRVKLLQLIKPAQQLFLEGAFTASHAILLARLGTKEQEQAIRRDPRNHGQKEGLFEREHEGGSLFDDPDERAPRWKPVSVAEFERYIAKTFRFRPENEDLPQLFPKTAGALDRAAQDELAVVPITCDYHVDPALKGKNERIYGPKSWKRADGEVWRNAESWKREKSKTCDHSVMGVIVIGTGRGEAFRVCVAKEKCQVHWPKKKAKKTSTAGGAEKEERWEREERLRQERYEAERIVLATLGARYKRARPAIEKAVDAALSALPEKLLVPMLFKACNASGSAATVKAAAQAIVSDKLMREAFPQWGFGDYGSFAKACKAKLGVDITKILDQAAPVEKAGKKK